MYLQVALYLPRFRAGSLISISSDVWDVPASGRSWSHCSVGIGLSYGRGRELRGKERGWGLAMVIGGGVEGGE